MVLSAFGDLAPMQFIPVFAASLILSGWSGASSVMPVAEPSDGTEVYVAQMDQDWNVTRETRVPCPIETGCVVTFGLSRPDGARVKLLLTGIASGRIAVKTLVEDRDGRSVPQADRSITLDRTGFGADHFQPGLTGLAAAPAAVAAVADQPLILLAVKVPGWTAPLNAAMSSLGDRT
ncbi:hypothetical protein LGH83_12195 [Lichenihabitans sp. PAMC28606]|uniref:hypothetical protein n=1 Tax=Lichenihabitans sp. PAMC28606 TaxID=2880932 RepID=UPI001D09D15A|nr:hypothetical protein [Lichenihabitans sp. PAMC28606]UDL93346.1 hypothetical protein LGH83_12195 [Lichenihabitans sp. PAMC28606]